MSSYSRGTFANFSVVHDTRADRQNLPYIQAQIVMRAVRHLSPPYRAIGAMTHEKRWSSFAGRGFKQAERLTLA
jgi:hypothetical protein